jgi:hypothetical protein
MGKVWKRYTTLLLVFYQSALVMVSSGHKKSRKCHLAIFPREKETNFGEHCNRLYYGANPCSSKMLRCSSSHASKS